MSLSSRREGVYPGWKSWGKKGTYRYAKSANRFQRRLLRRKLQRQLQCELSPNGD